eukprot:12318553-Prorocentrum_lima.AAC.1
MTSSLVGSEMCIRDSARPPHIQPHQNYSYAQQIHDHQSTSHIPPEHWDCLLYTSDAADDM